MKLIATYIHDDHTSVKDHGEYVNHTVRTENGRTYYAFENDWGEIEWSDKLVKHIEHVGNETHITIDWRD